MTRLWPNTLALALLPLVLPANAASAQAAAPEPNRRWEVGFLGGWYSGATPYFLNGPVSGEIRDESAPTYGLRLGFLVNPRIEVEVSWIGGRPERAFANPPSRTIGHVQLGIGEVDLNYFVGRGSVRGFLSGGLGGVGTGGTHGGTNLTANIGAGVRVSLDRRFSLRLQGRFRESYGNLGIRDTVAYCDSLGCYSYRHTWYSSYGFSGGLGYAF